MHMQKIQKSITAHMNRQIGGAQQIRKIGLQLRRRTGTEDQNAFFTGRASAHEEANSGGCT